MNYSPTTIASIGSVIGGVRVETSVLANATYLDQTQREAFSVKGRIMVVQLFCEAITAFGAQATVMLYNFTSTTPAIAVQPMCANSGSLSGFAQGRRHVFVGGAVATAAVLTATAGISDVICVSPHIIGTTGGVGTIGFLTATASQLSGTCKFCLCYAPLSDGACAAALL